MPSRTGPRRLVFSHLDSLKLPQSPSNVWEERTAGSKEPAVSVASGPDSSPLSAGNLRLYSWNTPGLLEGQTYSATITQKITYEDAPSIAPLVSSKSFSVQSSKWTLDPAVVNSVYPPQGHLAYSNVLPHVLFNNLTLPWMMTPPAPADDSSARMPWIALLLLTEDELTLSTDQKTTLGGLTSSKQDLSQTPNMAVNLTVNDLLSMDTAVSQPISGSDGLDGTSIQAIFLPGGLFDGLFASYPADSINPSTGVSSPSLTRFQYMSHVRQVNTTGMANQTEAEVGTFSVTVSPRCGPQKSTSTKVYAHLVSLAGVPDKMAIPTGKTQGLAALVSLYSWSYTVVPLLDDTLEKLGAAVQPLRNQDSVLNASHPEAVTDPVWIQERMLAGYTLVKYRTQIGESTIAIQRGPLVPTSDFSPAMPTSDFGTDLAILDPGVGVLDITFQLAWELGRTLAMADRSFSTALMRLRTQIHVQTLAQAKVSASAESNYQFVARAAVFGGLPGTAGTLGTIDQIKDASELDFTQRWRRPELQTGTRSTLSFRQPDVQDNYKKVVVPTTLSFAEAAPSPPASQPGAKLYNEFNSPSSPDFAVILSWCMDRWFLHGIPFSNLVPDPAFLPQESVRTFYIDRSWINAFLDGALSVAEHFLREDDVIRTALMNNLNQYLATNLENGYPPQVPQWGFFLRTEFVIKFPDLRISAPWSDPKDPRAEVLRMEKIDQDLLLVLFDRTPDSGAFPEGIILQVPEHQVTFSVGNIGGSQGDELTVDWKKVYASSIPQDYGPSSFHPAPTSYTSAEPHLGVFDFKVRSLCFPHFAAAAVNALQKWPDNPTSNVPTASAALTGAQLMASVPQLVLGKSKNTATPKVQPTLAAPIQLSSSRTLEQRVDKQRDTPNPPSNVSTHLRHEPLTSTMLQRATTLAEPSLALRDSVNPPLPDLTRDDAASKGSTITAGDMKTQLSLNNASNIWTEVMGAQVGSMALVAYQHNLVAYLPQQLGFFQDVHFDVSSAASGLTGNLKSIQISFSVGTSTADMIAPFLTPADIAQLKSMTQEPNRLNWDYRHKPHFSDSQLPTARFVGTCCRWITQTNWEPSTPGAPNGVFMVTLIPNTSSGSWDITKITDHSFVLEGVQLNWWGQNMGSDTSQFQVPVTETYTTGMAQGAWTVTVSAVDATKNALTPLN